MHKKNLKCSIGCNKIKTQYHIFEKCKPLFRRNKTNQSTQLNKIYGTLDNQKSIIIMLIQIDEARKQLLEEIVLPQEK